MAAFFTATKVAATSLSLRLSTEWWLDKINGSKRREATLKAQLVYTTNEI